MGQGRHTLRSGPGATGPPYNVNKISLQQPVHGDRSALSDGRADKAQYIVRSHQGTTSGTERSSVLGGRRKEKARSKRVAIEHSKPVRQPLGMTDHRESNDAQMVPVVLSWLTGGDDMCHKKEVSCQVVTTFAYFLLTPPLYSQNILHYLHSLPSFTTLWQSSLY